MSINAWFSTGKTQSACSASAAHDSIALYGDVTTSSSSEGNTDTLNRYTSGYSSASAARRYDPSPLPVPPPRE